MPKGVYVKTAEHIAKLAAAKRGKKHTAEHNAKIAATLLGNQRRRGVPHSLEDRRRIGAGLKKRSDEERFWSHVDKTDGCWVWTGPRFSNGYGIFNSGSKTDKTKRALLAHRVSYGWANGPIPPGMFCCHACDNPPCVRPDHLFLGTPAENSADKVRKGRSVTPDRTMARNGRAKLTIESVRAIRERYVAGGISARALGAEYGVSESVAFRAIKRQSWADV